MTQLDALDDRPLMAVVNDEIDRLHGSLDLADSEFFCECGHTGCAERVKLSRREFASLREESRPVLVAAHVDGAFTALATQGGSERRGL